MPNIPEVLAGRKVFPVLPGDKLPALGYGWQSRATDDAEQVAEWDSTMENLNWGIAAGPSGLFIFDIDPEGISTWKAMQDADPQLREAVERSYTVKTPRGGFHHYFEGYGPTTASAIADGIDTRGGYPDDATGRMKSAGYVVLPGSVTVAGPKTVDGEYTEIGGSLFPMPPAVLALVPEKKKGSVLGLSRDPAKDQPRNVEWAKDLIANYVKEGRVSIEGKGGNNTAFQVAASILDKAISPALTYELLEELWNPHCSPAWDDFELEQIISNAAEYGEETGGGSKGFEDNASAFAHFLGTDAGDAAAPETKPGHQRGRMHIQWIDEFAKNAKDPEWLIRGLIPARGTGMMFGASGSYKSFLALDIASCIAYGHTGQWGAPPVCNDVIYFAGEGPIGTAKQRHPAWLEWQEVATPGRLAIFPRVPHLSDNEGWAGIMEDVVALSLQPRLIVIDTLARLLTGFDENSTKDATMATGFIEELATAYDCFVLVIHHTGKDEGKGARGSSAFFANTDTVLSTQKKGNGTLLRVRKHKDADAPDDPIFLGVKAIGKSIVLEKGLAPEESNNKVTAKTSWSDANEICARISKNGGRIGMAILCQEIAGDLGLDKAKIKRELANKAEIQWLREGEEWRIPAGEQEFDL